MKRRSKSNDGNQADFFDKENNENSKNENDIEVDIDDEKEQVENYDYIVGGDNNDENTNKFLKDIIDNNKNKPKKSIKELVDETMMTDERLQDELGKYIENMVKTEVSKQFKNVKINNTLNERVNILFQNAVENLNKNKKNNNNNNSNNDNIYKNLHDEIEMDSEVLNIAEKYNNNNNIYLNKKFIIENNFISIKNKFEYGCRIKELLDEIDHSAIWLHKRTGIPSSTLSGIINGITKVSLENAYIISMALEKTIEEVFPIIFQEDEK